MKTIRTWVYALLKYQDKIVVIEKKRWPFTWLYDLPWWKIEHWEWNIKALKRELFEELWFKESQYEIENLLSVEEDYIKHIWKWEEKDEHIIAIVYKVNIINWDIDLNHKEKGGDSNWIKLIQVDDNNLENTNILNKIINKLKK